MTQSLDINGREYLPSSLLAERFGYTSDYVSRLAREKKITASRVGRQWFVDAESLQNFSKTVSTEKVKRSEELRRQRKVEHAIHQERVEVEDVQRAGVPVAFAQAFAVLCCGLFAGLLGFVASESNLYVADLMRGAEQVSKSITSSLFVTSHNAVPSDQTALVSESTGDVRRTNTPAVTTSQQPEPPSQPAEVLNGLVLLASDTASGTIERIRNTFSDEVDVVFDGPDTGMIQPVFKKRTDEAYRFVMVPVNAENE